MIRSTPLLERLKTVLTELLRNKPDSFIDNTKKLFPKGRSPFDIHGNALSSLNKQYFILGEINTNQFDQGIQQVIFEATQKIESLQETDFIKWPIYDWILEVLDPFGNITTIPLLEGETLGIGRGEENELTLQENLISRKHCSILVSSPNFSTIDNNSTNGTFLDGKRIEKINFRQGQVIMIGNFQLTIRDIDPTEKLQFQG